MPLRPRPRIGSDGPAGVFAVLFSLALRALFGRLIDEELFKRRVVVLGAGRRASGLLKLRRDSKMRGRLSANGWLPVPRTPLPFPSILAASANDPLARYDRVEQYAADWGSRLVDIGTVGHLNPAAGFSRWPRAGEFLRELGA